MHNDSTVHHAQLAATEVDENIGCMRQGIDFIFNRAMVVDSPDKRLLLQLLLCVEDSVEKVKNCAPLRLQVQRNEDV